MNGKRYPEEFKIEAVKQVTIAGHSIADVAARLGTSTHSLYAWVKRYGPDAEQHNHAATVITALNIPARQCLSGAKISK